jgi:hypothetical protein
MPYLFLKRKTSRHVLVLCVLAFAMPQRALSWNATEITGVTLGGVTVSLVTLALLMKLAFFLQDKYDSHQDIYLDGYKTSWAEEVKSMKKIVKFSALDENDKKFFVNFLNELKKKPTDPILKLLQDELHKDKENHHTTIFQRAIKQVIADNHDAELSPSVVRKLLMAHDEELQRHESKNPRFKIKGPEKITPLKGILKSGNREYTWGKDIKKKIVSFSDFSASDQAGNSR